MEFLNVFVTTWRVEGRRGGSWLHGVRDLGSLDGRATAGEGLGGSLTPSLLP